MKMKIFFSGLIALVMCGISFNAQAQGPWDISATAADRVTATLAGGTLTISGTGAMQDYTGTNAPWYSAASSIMSLVIEQGVTSIGNFAFIFCSNVTDVTIANSVTSIGQQSFDNCRRLTSLTIPNSVISIGVSAFNYCDSLISMTLSNAVTSIGDAAFMNCKGLTSITLPTSISAIGKMAFYYCISLTSITCLNPSPSNITLGDGVFSNMNKTTCVLNVPTSSVSLYQAADQWKDFTHINGVATAIEAVEAPDLNVYSQAGNVIIDSKTLAIKSISVYALSGQLLKAVESGNNRVSIPQSFNPPILIVKVALMDGRIVTKKLVISD